MTYSSLHNRLMFNTRNSISLNLRIEKILMKFIQDQLKWKNCLIWNNIQDIGVRY